jgi:hypothetical protein
MQIIQHVKMGKIKKNRRSNCQRSICLENLKAQFASKEITLGRYLEGLSLLIAKKN